MKKTLLTIAVMLSALVTTTSQIFVNKHDISKNVDVFYIYRYKKTAESKERYFIEYFQKGFNAKKLDTKEVQIIRDSTGKKFDDGDWDTLASYIKSCGYEQGLNVVTKIGKNTVELTCFVRKKTE